MDVATVDLWSTSGDSALHRATPLAKVGAAVLLLAAVVVVQNLLVVGAVFALVLAAARRAALPLGKLVLGALYPAIFAILFALAQFNGGYIVPATIIAKAVTAASVVLLLVATTPYPRLFAVFGLVLPGIVLDVLYTTYRSVFILLRCLGDSFTAVRLRGGLAGRGVVRRARNLAAALALSVLHAFEISERTYAVMHLRGYSGRISGERAGRLAASDLPLLAGAAATAGVAFAWRYGWRSLNPYSWLPPAVAVLALLTAVVLPLRAHRPEVKR
jgi:cobalt/nickel transport system permease protein